MAHDMRRELPAPSARCEIRLLGPMFARRADGSIVSAGEWTTAKTADLVRLLALSAGRPVPVEKLGDALWPEADEEHSKASLRTAVAQIRRVLGKDCIHRDPEGLTLYDTWVDAVAFKALATQAGRYQRNGMFVEALVSSREALALYLNDFRTQEASSDWVQSEAVCLAQARRVVLGDAADAAVSLGLMRDAWDLAHTLLRLDPMSERAHRALMRAHAGLGEIDQSMRAFENCRQMLRRSFGVDPSPQTMAAHLQILSTPSPTVRATPLVGRTAERKQLEALLTEARQQDELAVIEVRGGQGSGKTRLLHEMLRDVKDGVSTVRAAGPDTASLQRAVDAVRVAPTDRSTRLLVTVDDVHLAERSLLSDLGEALTQAVGSAVLTVTAGPGPDGRYAEVTSHWPGATERNTHVIALQPLGIDEVTRLAEVLMQGEPTPSLVREIVETTGCWPGPVVQLVSGWIRAGNIVLTSRGMALMPARAFTGDEEPVGLEVLRLCTQLSPLQQQVVLHLAVLGRPVALPVLVALLRPQADDASEIARSLDHLVDLATATRSKAGYFLRDPMLGDALVSWLRPSERQMLHQRLADSGLVPIAEQLEHWLEAGETGLACGAALDAADEAIVSGRYDEARTYLQRVCELAELEQAGSADQMEIFERLGDMNAMLGRHDEAGAAYSTAIAIARRARTPGQERLVAKRDGMPPHAYTTGPQAASTPTAIDEGQSLLTELGHDTASWPTEALERRLRASVDDADRRLDPVTRINARLLLASLIHTPRHDLTATGRWAKQVLAMTVHPNQRAAALVVAATPRVLLGEAREVSGDLTSAAELAGQAGDVELARRAQALRLLVAHDLGDPLFHQLRAEFILPDGSPTEPEWAWLAVRVQTERNELAGAAVAARTRSTSGTSLLATKLQRLAVLELQAATESTAVEIASARRDVEESMAVGYTLLVPEASVWLCGMEARLDKSAAREDFDRFDQTVLHDGGHPREHTLRLLARACIRLYAGEIGGAVDATRAAAEYAEQHGLLALSATCQRLVARALSEAGRDREAARLESAAGALERAIGAQPARLLPRRGGQVPAQPFRGGSRGGRSLVLAADHVPSTRRTV